ncbi:hypothetical protein DAEQUDRAFT_421601 [Daedalea quercina L-15889]|uniref:Uncharacterized protein n=1 Tax=Daedalea quercina L-15889 TaxID=1314783 RepID=A0A165TLR3_9APHY|nr:hypothetical protein DAEQUDRAFT_421601 [Daedalea quercina L-15889]
MSRVPSDFEWYSCPRFFEESNTNICLGGISGSQAWTDCMGGSNWRRGIMTYRNLATCRALQTRRIVLLLPLPSGWLARAPRRHLARRPSTSCNSPTPQRSAQGSRSASEPATIIQSTHSATIPSDRTSLPSLLTITVPLSQAVRHLCGGLHREHRWAEDARRADYDEVPADLALSPVLLQAARSVRTLLAQYLSAIDAVRPCVCTFASDCKATETREGV